MTMNSAVFLYARVDSRRLPGKIFLSLGGRRVIDVVHARASRVNAKRVVVLTTNRKVDDLLADHCSAQGYDYFRGDAADLVRRTQQALSAVQADYFLRVNGDCPFFEPRLARAALEHILRSDRPQMVSNIVQRSFPYGVAVEWIASDAYNRLAPQAGVSEREHVTQHLYRMTESISLSSMLDSAGNTSHQRLTLDTVDDARRLERLVSSHDIVASPYWEVLGNSEPVPVFKPVSGTVNSPG